MNCARKHVPAFLLSVLSCKHARDKLCFLPQCLCLSIFKLLQAGEDGLRDGFFVVGGEEGGKDDQSELDGQAVDGETGVEEQVGYIMCAIFGGCECYLQQCVKCGIKL